MITRRLILPALLFVAGCAAHPRAQSAGSATHPAIAHRAALDPKAMLTLDQIEPRPVLGSAPAPTTDPSHDRPPLAALDLYAQARVAQLTNQRYTAINLLEQAAKADPTSFELQSELARTYLSLSAGSDHAESALEHAAKLKPDDLRTQAELGRLFLSRGDLPKATEHLRLALQTTDYRNDDEYAALADYHLAQALGKQGYDKAALGEYTRLLQRLERTPHSVRLDPELSYWLSRPELLYAEVARLHEKQGESDEALQAYQFVAEHNPDDIATRQHIVKLLVDVGRRDEAARDAADTIVRTHASAESLDMLREVYRGDDRGAVEELHRLVREHPQDHTVLFALAHLLSAIGQPAEAVQTISRVATTMRDSNGSGDTQVVRKLFSLYSDQNKTDDAAKLLVETSAARPDSLDELTPMWVELITPTRRNRMSIERLAALPISSEAEPARQYWIARLALSRETLARTSLDAALGHNPPYPPAFRLALSRIVQGLIPPEDRGSATEKLIADARKRGPAGLADELTAESAIADAQSATTGKEDKIAAAIASFQAAEALGDHSPDLRLEYASALKLKGDTAGYERVMWKLATDRPDDSAVYNMLFHYYEDQGQAERAVAVSQTWLLADPQSSGARLLRVLLLSRAGVTDEADRVLADLYKQRPDDPEVLETMRALYSRRGQGDKFTQTLEKRLGEHPDDVAAAELVLDSYAHQKRTSEAVHLVDTTRNAVSSDPDLLYYVAHFYERVGLPKDEQLTAVENTLEMALKIAPSHPGANNDLGYTWADANRNLAEAEGLIRKAVDAEPDNNAYLDSLGWVLYKRGRFAEARTFLEKAIDPDATADPVVLDHLADTLYRLDATADAQHRWQEAAEHLDERLKLRGEVSAPGDELGTLKLQLQQKLRQIQQGGRVNVAPIVETPEKQV